MGPRTSRTRRGIGARVRVSRKSRHWTQRQLAARAGVSQTLVSLVERGCRGASLESIESLAIAAGAVVLTHPAFVDDRPAERPDTAHARTVGALVRVLESHGYACALEQPVAAGGRIGWIDVLAFQPSTRLLVVAEVKVDPRQVGGLARQVETYVEGCLRPAARLGWRPRELFAVAILLATAAADGFAAANRLALRAEFPVRGTRVLSTLFAGASATGRGMIMLDPARRGRRAFLTLRADGRRTEAPYADGPGYLARASTADGRRARAHGRSPPRARR